MKPGIEVLAEKEPQLVAGKRVGLIMNPTAVDSHLRSDVDVLRSIPGVKIVALFAGEHGLWGAEPDGKKLDGSIDPYTGAPVYSLYGATLAPKPEWLQGVDVLIFDIQNSGSALYTFKYTMSFAMEAAAKAGVPFIVLDRPNPAGGDVVEGPMMPAHDIWRHPLPLRHGMTNGELATMWNEEYHFGAKLTVVKMEGWRRDMTWDETGLPWVAPSPNLPTADTDLAYVGEVLLESTPGVSVGRGTAKPFLTVGAPGVDAMKAAADLNARHLPGVIFRPAYFQPNSGEKLGGQMCGGVEIYFTDRKAYRAVPTTLSIVDALRNAGGTGIGNPGGPMVAPGASTLQDKLAAYQTTIQQFLQVRQKYLLY